VLRTVEQINKKREFLGKESTFFQVTKDEEHMFGANFI